MLAATGDSAVNCFVFALDDVTGCKAKAEWDILNSHQTVLVDFGFFAFMNTEFKQFENIQISVFTKDLCAIYNYSFPLSEPCGGVAFQLKRVCK